jgi:predicted ribosome quality control (RQC) complex YloA/Tae2 family protein
LYFDTLTVSAVRDELAERLLGGRVQRLVQPAELTIGLEIYAGYRYQLLLSAESQSPGALLVQDKLRRGVETPTPFYQLLVKYVRDSRLEAIEQPPLERILRLTFNGEFGPVNLVVEIMGRYSNLILVGMDEVIMDAIKRVPPSLNRYRSILPHQPYVAPPPQEKENPLLLTVNLLRMALEGEEGPLWRRLVNKVAGISPLLAREIVFRAFGDTQPEGPFQQEDYAELLKPLSELMRLPQTHQWTPCIGFEVEDDSAAPATPPHPAAYAPYALTHWPEREQVNSIFVAIQRVNEARRTFDPYQSVRDRLNALIAEQIERQEARLASLGRSLVPPEQVERLQFEGNAILAMAWSIQPGQRELVVNPADFGWEQGGDQPLSISLDPELSAADNAQRRFGEYRRLKKAADEVPQIMAEAERELAYLRQLRAEVALAEDRPQLDEVEQELAEGGYIRARKQKAHPTGKSVPLSVHAPDGSLILVGRNSRQNHEVTFRRGGPDDLWLHAHGVPGSHVIVKTGGAEVSEETLNLAARLAAYYSTARGEPSVQVDYTPRRYVRDIKGGRPGMVTYTHEQTVVVPAQVDEALLEE